MQGWPERVRAMQANWIGKSEGVRIGFPYEIAGDKRRAARVHDPRRHRHGRDLLCGRGRASAGACTRRRDHARLAAFIEECKRGPAIEAELATQEKKGMATGLSVRHPLTGDAVPVWVGNYVLMSYGEGAVMGVPAHDERDFEFAKKYHLPIKPVIEVANREYSTDAWQPWYADHGRCVNSGKYDGLDFRGATDAVAADLERLGLGEKQTTWRLRDWGISRQRYWGCPIPLIHCDGCGTVPVPDEQLPVLLPENLVPDGSGNPLLEGRRHFSPARVRDAAAPRGARPTPWIPSWIHPGTSCATRAATTTCPCWIRACTTGCRWTSTSAASSMRYCTSCTRASGRACCGSSGPSNSRSRSPTCSRRAWS